MRNLLDDEVFHRIVFADTVAPGGVLAILASVPSEATDIKCVAQDTFAADGALGPDAGT